MRGGNVTILLTVITFLMLSLFWWVEYPVLYNILRIVVVWAVMALGQTLVMHLFAAKIREVQEAESSNEAEEQWWDNHSYPGVS